MLTSRCCARTNGAGISGRHPRSPPLNKPYLKLNQKTTCGCKIELNAAGTCECPQCGAWTCLTPDRTRPLNLSAISQMHRTFALCFRRPTFDQITTGAASGLRKMDLITPLAHPPVATAG